MKRLIAWFRKTFSSKKRSELHYFVPGKIILHIEHPANMSADNLADALEVFLTGQPLAEQKQGRKSAISSKAQNQGKSIDHPTEREWQGQLIPPSKDAIITFPLEVGKGRYLSMVTTRLKDSRMHQRDLFKLSVSINDEIGNNGIPVTDDVTLRSTTPNWLLSGTHHGPATGGPGSWPIEAHPPLEEQEWKPTVKDAQKMNAIGLGNDQGKNVHVAILDTAPAQHALETAYAEWRWQKHGLIESMLSPNGPLRLYSATGDDFHTLHETINYSIQGHHYWERDHGLFVAGIIHAIAPKATLHLVEVLNPFGVGTLETVGQGLLNVIRKWRNIKRPLIINCSFMFDLPDENALKMDFEVDPGSNILTKMLMSIQEIFDLVTQQKRVFVVAAAGNDSNGTLRQPTRYPAAFKNVYSVGALPKDFPMTNGRYETAAYSNLTNSTLINSTLADIKHQNDKSYATLGGEPGPEKGVLSVYIDEFPTGKRAEGCLPRLWRFFRLGRKPHAGHIPAKPHGLMLDDIEYERNTTGWAWWAGTSFATAVFTGTLAALPSQPGKHRALQSFQESQTALHGLIQQAQTVQGENVILVEQG